MDLSQISHQEFFQLARSFQNVYENTVQPPYQTVPPPPSAVVEIINEEPDDSTTQSLLAAIGSHASEKPSEVEAQEDPELPMPVLEAQTTDFMASEATEDIPRTPKRRAEGIEELVAMKKRRLGEETLTSPHSEHTDTSGSSEESATTSPTSQGPSAEDSFLSLLRSMSAPELMQQLAIVGQAEFTEVPSRLSLLTSTTKHKMSVDEVRRRIDGAESFNLSLLGALFRRAKTPNMSENITEQLKKYGLSIPKGRRRKTELTLFSAFTEGEATKLAGDFNSLTTELFPTKQLAAYAKDHGSPAMEHLKMFREQIEAFKALLEKDSSPVNFSKPSPQLDASLQEPLSHFSLLTHGFGTPAILVGIHMMQAFVEAQMSLQQSQ
ncbi:hypothetical protein QR680_016983 [Steinernema hermaphroditum]|uniref:Transcription factor AP-2 C-terminal domain-containing protein n=1 Tax=Steinernema hermaphroditum TaxID=289476 RepID=A0AA39HF32_9BILA|nr:hypothetical protein QR680_016983 [Steinernema hermaphroditum]